MRRIAMLIIGLSMCMAVPAGACGTGGIAWNRSSSPRIASPTAGNLVGMMVVYQASARCHFQSKWIASIYREFSND